MKILIPTDFSKLSKVAVHYASKLARKLNAEIVLLHVVFIDTSVRARAILKTNQILDAIVDNATQDLLSLTNEIKKEVGNKINVSYKIVKGYPVEDVIEAFAQYNNIDLIVMGTKGASGLKKVLMGSNTTAVINNSDIPVITVPEYARFKSLKHIVYATDMTNINAEMKTLVPLVKLFDSTIHILHVISPGSKKKIDANKIITDISGKMKYPKIIFHLSVNDDITEGIDEYIAETKIDMLAMFTHNLTFFEKLFDKSVTRQMAFQTWVPLLTMKK